jgi:hypothetical protein
VTVARAAFAVAVTLTLVVAPAGSSRVAGVAVGPLGTIAFSDGDVCLVNADGSGRRCLTHSGIDYAPVAWSADGRLLAFERVHDDPGPGDRYEVVTIGVDGRRQTTLTPRGVQDD